MRFRPASLYCWTSHLRFVGALAVAAVRGGEEAPPGEKPRVVMIGNHSLAGNLQAFYEYAQAAGDVPYHVCYATIDRREYETLSKTYPAADLLLATRVADLRKILAAPIVVASHGPGIFFLVHHLRPGMHFVDVGHGVGFKGFFPKHFRSMGFYACTLLSSQRLLEIYRDVYLWRPEQLLVTGYARLDRFRRAAETARRVREELKLDPSKRMVLYAPTWRKPGDVGEIPFGVSTTEFLQRMDALCERIGAMAIFRLHMNSSLGDDVSGYGNIRNISQKIYPETNDLLTAMDVVITDWSTIAPDFAALDRPVIFLDTPMPPPYDQVPPPVPRGGDIVRSMDELLAAIELRTVGPEPRVTPAQQKMKDDFHGDTLDGKAAERYDRVLRGLLGKERVKRTEGHRDTERP